MADFNGDHRDDLAVIASWSQELWIYTSQGDGTFKVTSVLIA